MCGRYALALRPSEVRQQLQESHMPSQEAPEDDDVRQSYNFAPGYHGLVYRADMPDHGSGGKNGKESDLRDTGASVDADNHNGAKSENELRDAGESVDADNHNTRARDESELRDAGESADADNNTSAKEKANAGDSTRGDEAPKETIYKLQSMKWGLIPFWTKRNPDYGSMMKTINCRDDSLAQTGGMWASMKQRKRCIIVAQGFFEWLKKNGGKEKIPHFVKRKDGQLMCFAGLWDCVKYEDSEEKHYTYTIITTDSNKQLKFLHDRMPVILDNGSDDLQTWLDPGRSEWSKELQSLLKPYNGELECYPVSKEVGKVGNNSPSFLIPIDSKENKNNIANFFGNQKKQAKSQEVKKEVEEVKKDFISQDGRGPSQDPDEHRETTEQEDPESNAPLPSSPQENKKGVKRERESSALEDEEEDHSSQRKAAKIEPTPRPKKSPVKPSPAEGGKTRSATSNGTVAKSPSKKDDGKNKKITSFFGGK
ncbi:DUF159-domain-containing protein [Aulographum hederae CBS 113979]|uniref:DUF159-domain-containing protein n=1 Tax=Aulographum hederae CBS 113979 TaxID=1176131 RepID=A0A6G1H9M3_9PEZI|nr:DUF159-domain-containing protein [Aulographum hederae CBS 113979]